MRHIFLLLPIACGCATVTGLPKALDTNEDGRYTRQELASGVVDLVVQSGEQQDEVIRLQEALKAKEEQIQVYTSFIKDISSSNNECVQSLAQHARECILADPE